MRPVHAFRAVTLAAALTVSALLVHALLVLILAAVIGVILALPLGAAADRAQRAGLPRTVGALAALALLAGVLTGLGFALVPAFTRQARQFADQLPSILTGVQHQLRHLGLGHGASLNHQVTSFIQGYIQHPQRLAGPLSQVGGAVLVFSVGVVVVAVSAFTLAVRPEPVMAFALRLVPVEHRPRARAVVARVRAAWLGWMVAVGIDMAVLGTLLWLGLALIGLPFAVGFATFSAFMTIIPNYGSVISAVPPLLAGLSQSPTRALLVLVVYLVVNQIEGNLILPLIMARTVDMHPAVVAIGLLIMAALFGLIGVFIAIPLLSLFTILVQALWIEPNEERACVELPRGG